MMVYIWIGIGWGINAWLEILEINNLTRDVTI